MSFGFWGNEFLNIGKKIFLKEEDNSDNFEKFLTQQKEIEEKKNIKKSYYGELYSKYGSCRSSMGHKDEHTTILLISDTHGCLDKPAHNEDSELLLNRLFSPQYKLMYGAIFLLGDITPGDIKVMMPGFENRKVFGILGDEDPYDLYRQFYIPDISGKVVSVEGVKFAGFPGSYLYKGNTVSFYQEDSIEFGLQMKTADVLLSHAAPYDEDEKNPIEQGLMGISEYIYKNHIHVHYHGHNHRRYKKRLSNECESYGIYKSEVVEI